MCFLPSQVFTFGLWCVFSLNRLAGRQLASCVLRPVGSFPSSLQRDPTSAFTTFPALCPLIFSFAFPRYLKRSIIDPLFTVSFVSLSIRSLRAFFLSFKAIRVRMSYPLHVTHKSTIGEEVVSYSRSILRQLPLLVPQPANTSNSYWMSIFCVFFCYMSRIWAA